jgi:hypothetical protein
VHADSDALLLWGVPSAAVTSDLMRSHDDKHIYEITACVGVAAVPEAEAPEGEDTTMAELITPNQKLKHLSTLHASASSV